jgi:hypothetical protein
MLASRGVRLKVSDLIIRPFVKNNVRIMFVSMFPDIFILSLLCFLIKEKVGFVIVQCQFLYVPLQFPNQVTSFL